MPVDFQCRHMQQPVIISCWAGRIRGAIKLVMQFVAAMHSLSRTACIVVGKLKHRGVHFPHIAMQVQLQIRAGHLAAGLLQSHCAIGRKIGGTGLVKQMIGKYLLLSLLQLDIAMRLHRLAFFALHTVGIYLDRLFGIGSRDDRRTHRRGCTYCTRGQ